MSIILNIPTKVYCEPNLSTLLFELLRLYGKRVLIIVDSYLYEKLDSLLPDVFSDNELFLHVEKCPLHEPKTGYIDNLTNSLKAQECFSVVLAIGGGSSMDLAKALAISLRNENEIWSYANLSNRPPLDIDIDPLPVIAVPTTAGTGSEVTPYSVLSNSDTGQKGTIQDPKIFPQVAIICPELYVTLSKELTALIAMDAFAHAFESYFYCSKESPIAEAFSITAIDLILSNLLELYHDPCNQNLRKVIAQASMYAGLAIAHRGTSVAHAIAETLASKVNISHSQSVSISTIPVLKASLKDNDFYGKLGNLSNRLLIPKSKFLDNLENIYSSLNLNKSLASIINIDSIDSLPDKVMASIMEYKFRPLKQHPIQFTESELFEIIKEVLI